MAEAQPEQEKTALDKLAHLVVQLELADRMLESIRNDDAFAGNREEEIEKTKRGKDMVQQKLDEYEDKAVTKVRKVSNILKEHSTEDAVEEASSFIEKSREQREAIVVAVAGERQELLNGTFG